MPLCECAVYSVHSSASAGCWLPVAQVMMTLLPFYLQNGLGFSAIISGLGMLPFALTMLICPRIGARLASRFSPASMMAAGLILVGCGNLFSALAVGHGGYLSFALATAVTGAGAGLLNGDTQKNIMACVPRDRVGMASGMSTTMRFSAIVLAQLGDTARSNQLFQEGLNLLDERLLASPLPANALTRSTRPRVLVWTSMSAPSPPISVFTQPGCMDSTVGLLSPSS